MTRRFPIFSLLLVSLLGAGYLATLLPGIGYSGDTIKFQYLGKVLGIPHAPGYPLYMLLNHLFVTLFPIGTTAYKANLLSAIFAVGACWMLFKLLELLGTGRFIALVIALAFGFTETYWSQAIVAEVYSLLVLFMASVSYFLVKWHLQRRDRDFYIATALYALSFGNHLLAITLLPAFVYLVVVTDKRVFVQPRKILWVLFVIVLGASQYLYLFWRLNDPQTPYNEGFNGHNFFYFVTGGPFKPLMFAFTPTEILQDRIPHFFIRQNLLIFGLAVLGAISPQRPLRPVRAFLLIYFFSNAFYAVNYKIPDINLYYIVNDFALVVLAGLGLSLFAYWPRLRHKWAPGLLLLLPITFYIFQYRLVDQSDNTGQQQQIEKVLKAVVRDALIITTDYLDKQALLYYLIGEGWGAQHNLHEVGQKWVSSRLQSYLEEGKPLPTRNGPKVGLPIYAYPCATNHFSQEDFTVTWFIHEQHLPKLCHIKALPHF